MEILYMLKRGEQLQQKLQLIATIRLAGKNNREWCF